MKGEKEKLVVPEKGEVRREVKREYKPVEIKRGDLYWVGTIPGGPRQNVSVGGCTFPAITERGSIDPFTGRRNSIPRVGAVVELTAEEVEDVLNRLEYDVVDSNGKIRAIKDGAGAPNPYIKMDETLEGAKPLGAYVFMVKIDSVEQWPSLESFTIPGTYGEDENKPPLRWGEVGQFRMDKFPSPVMTVTRA